MKDTKQIIREIIYESIGLAADEHGIINQVKATDNVMKTVINNYDNQLERLRKDNEDLKKQIEGLTPKSKKIQYSPCPECNTENCVYNTHCTYCNIELP